MKWSWLVGRVWGTEIRLHASLLLLIPYALYATDPASWIDALEVLLLIAAIFACVLLHELGHTLAARLLGIEVKNVVLWPLGGVANLSGRPERTIENLTISAAGPFTNLVITFVMGVLVLAERLFFSSPLAENLPGWISEPIVLPILAGLLVANFALVVFNLVPIYPLDGGQIAHDVLKLIFGERHADYLMLLISLPLALALTGLGAWVGDILFVITGALLVIASLSLHLGLADRANRWALYLFNRGSYYLRVGDYDQAVAFYTQELNRRPHRSGLYHSRALAYHYLMADDAAWQDVNRSIQLSPRNYLAWTLKGEIAQAQGRDPLLILSCFNHAIQIQTDWPLAYVGRANLHLSRGRLNLAMADLNRAVTYQQGMVIVFLQRSILRYRMGDLVGARSDSEQALRFAPNWMLAFHEGFLSNLEGSLDWALDYYQRAEKRMPGAYQVYQGRADALYANCRPARALADYRHAIHLAPRQAELYLLRGRAYRRLGRLSLAAADFQQALSLPGFSHIHRKAQAELQAISWMGTGVLAPTAQPSELMSGSAGLFRSGTTPG